MARTVLSIRSTEVFKCLVRACAPPPVGTGGSSKAGIAAGRAAEALASRAKQAEKQFTPMLRGLVRSAGGRMEGLKYRFKEVKSLTRKIHDKAKERGLSIEESAERISDALRYTSTTKPKDYTRHVRSTIQSLKKEGYKMLELETHWQRGDAYNGVHAIFQHPNGTKIEVQFHTPQSFRAKMKNHTLYERFRTSNDPAERKRLTEEMTAVADAAEVPPGALRLGVKVFRPA